MERFMVPHRAVNPAIDSARTSLASAPAVDVGAMAKKFDPRGYSLHEHHHGHDERAEART
jgi:hypothetical protein